MISKTSFFNGTVLRKDITRFCPVWALYLVFGLLWAISVFDSRIYRGVQNILDTLTAFSLLNLIYGFIAAVMLFGDLFKSRLCNGIHALALRRKSWFATHCLAGLLFSFVPNVIFAIFITIYSCAEVWFLGLAWLLIMTLQYLFFFGLGVFSAMCCGSRLAATAVYALINFGSLIVRWFTVTFYEPQLYGVQISQTVFQRLCPIAQMLNMNFETLETLSGYYLGYKYSYRIIMNQAGTFPNDLPEWYMLIIGIVGLVFLALALLLYRRRQLECAGNLMAFRWMRPIFLVVYTLTMGALFEMIGGDLFGINYIFLAIGILVGFFTGQMLLQRTVAVFKLKAFAGCAAIGLALVVSIGLMSPLSFGLEQYVPNPKNVVSVRISGNTPDTYYSGEYYGPQDITYENPALIEALTKIHQAILEEGEYTPPSNADAPFLRLRYSLTNGTEIIRTYNYRQSGNVPKLLQQFYSMPENVLGYSNWEDYLDSISAITTQNNIFTGEQARQLIAAVRADCEAGTMRQDQLSSSNSYCYLKIADTDGQVNTVFIFHSCKNTIAWLEENNPQA